MTTKSTPATFLATRATSHEHAALAQLHRWYQIYENLPEAAQHFDILSDDVVIDAATGIVEGLAAFTPRLSNYAGWQNSHHVQSAIVTAKGDGRIEMTAEIIYRNVLPDGKRNAFAVHYETTLRERAGQLPVFTHIKMRPTATLAEGTFISAYNENRVKSFLHHWLYLMETGKGDASQFKQLLGPSFALDLGAAAPVTTFGDFAAWFKTVPAWLAESAHTIEALTCTTGADGLLGVAARFDWRGLNVGGQDMIAKTEHQWQLNPNPGGRFATMKRMQVKVLVPFQVVAG